MNMTNSEIAQRVRNRLGQDGMTLSKCCDEFNAKHAADISANATRPLNKDFLSRVSRNQFKVCTARIARLCEFLDIQSPESVPHPLEILCEQIADFRREINKDADFREKYAAIERFLAGLNLQELLDEY